MEQLNEALATLINQATTGIDASMGFLQAEIPDVITQLLLWHGVKSGVFFLSGATLIMAWVLAVLKFKKFIDKKSNEKWSADDFSFFGLISVLSGVLVLMPTFEGGLINLTWLQIWIAPKIFLIEYAASLVK